MKVRKAVVNDRVEWARMRNELWPGTIDEHLEEIDRFFFRRAESMEEVFVLDREFGRLGGFIELRIRNYAEGSTAEKIPYLEGWFIDEDLRNQGHGKELISIAETWARENNFSELASDTEITNLTSIAVHQSLGFEEVERIVCFLKKLR